VAIRPSSAQQIDTLVADLSGDSAVTREAAVARLTVIGARAVERVTAVAESAPSAAARAAAFRALEGIGDPRALDTALRAVDHADAAVAGAAIGAARVFIRGPRSASVVDRMAAVATDRDRPESIRLAALRALTDLDRSTVAPLLASLASDSSAAIRGAVALHAVKRRRAGDDPLDEVTRAAEQDLPDDPRVLHDAVVRAGDAAALPLLLRVVERIRERELSEAPARRVEWRTTRAAAHAALARRGSRLGLYDLRESLDAAREPLPVEFLAALSLVGDVSCLEAIAGAYARSASPGPAPDDWWRQHLADAFREILKRERITRRSSVMRKIEKKWKGAAELWAGRAG